jgi:hypothetical protein
MVTIAVVTGKVNGMSDAAPTRAPVNHATGHINTTARPD